MSRPVEMAAKQTVPVSTAAVSLSEGATYASTAASDARPSVAVLPFLNMIGDPAQEYFADGMTEDLITDLSKISGLCVIARNSSFTFKGKAVDVREAARTLGARYVVEGSARKLGERIRINAQLIDSQTGAHIWADRYDGELAKVFDLQDEILTKIVSALRVTLNVAEKGRLESRPTADLTAYELFLKGRREFYRLSADSAKAALELLERAVELDPGFAAAYVYLSHARQARAVMSSDVTEYEAGLRDALTAAERAVACDESLGSAHAALGWCRLWLRRYDEAMPSLEKALALAPNDAEVLGYYATALNYSGEPERALTMFDLAVRLDPLLPPNIRFTRGVAMFLLERRSEAMDVLRAVIELVPAFMPARFLMAVTLTELGRADEARAIGSEIRALQPTLPVGIMLRRIPFRDERIRERMSAGMRAAGLSD